jgi:class 3 adenylate cyclase
MATATGAEALLLEEAWRSERVINGFRFAIWTAICAAILISSFARGGPFYLGVAFGLVYGLAALVVGRLWLKNHYHPVVPYIASGLDVLVLAIIADRTHLFLKEQHLELMAERQLRDMLAALMLLLSVNVLRFSWRVTAWTTLCSVVALHVLLAIHKPDIEPVNVTVYTGHLIGLGAILGFAAQKLRVVIHRMKERDAFARFLPEPIVERLSRDPSAIQLGGEQQEGTVLFADIRGFTTIAEGMSPERVVGMLNEYFTEMVEEIFDNKGILDKFIGDGICAVFTPVMSEEDQARRAVRCAQGMLRRLDEINRARRERNEPPLQIGIGIHTGRLVAGNIGSPRRLEYTHVGDTVNTASRVEGVTKELGQPVVITASTRARLGDEVAISALGERALRGREPIELFAVITPGADRAGA